jgi:hypothetical protein
MINLEHDGVKFEVKYRIKDRDITMTVDEMIAHIHNNGSIQERVGFCVPFSVYYETKEQAERIDRAIEYRQVKRR